MKNYITNVLDPSTTPQSEALPNKNQVKNNAGGFVFAVTPWTRLERFLVLGSESGRTMLLSVNSRSRTSTA